MNARKMIRAVILGIAASAALFVSGCSDGNKAPDQGAVQKESPLMQKIKLLPVIRLMNLLIPLSVKRKLSVLTWRWRRK